VPAAHASDLQLRHLILLCLLALASLVLACDGSRQSPAASAFSGASTAPIAQPSVAAEDLATWIRFRRTYGLRSDPEWVIGVANAPGTNNELGIPLLPGEIDRVASLNLGIQDLVPAIERYGLNFPDAYAGVFIDGPIAVAQFSSQAELHRASIDIIFGAGAPVEVRSVPYSLDELDVFAKRVDSERGWFASIGAQLSSSSLRDQDNAVEISYKANGDVESLIRSHFGNPRWMQLRLEGPLPWTGPYGLLRVHIVDREGRPIDAGVLPISKDSRVTGSFLPKEVHGMYEERRIEAIDWEVLITYVDRDHVEVSTTVLVTVPAGGVGETTVVLDP